MQSAPESPCQGYAELVEQLGAAVSLGEVAVITDRVKQTLQHLIRAGGLRLPDRYRQTRADAYARRLLHRDPDGRFTAVVMTWGPGQRTSLHDHSGIWCVEGVVEGKMEVTQYDLEAESAGGYRFREKTRVTAEVGSAGCLIPPFEYHVLANVQADRPSITLHIYGGDMDHCHVFERQADGSYHRVTRQLAYSE